MRSKTDPFVNRLPAFCAFAAEIAYNKAEARMRNTNPAYQKYYPSGRVMKNGVMTPDIVPEDNMTEKEISIGIWGCGSPVEISAAGKSTDRGGSRDQRRLRYIRQCKKRLYLDLYISGKLNDYLAEINAQAEDMFFRVVKEVSAREDVTEALKASDQITWVQQSNSIREEAAEIVNKELIYI